MHPKVGRKALDWIKTHRLSCTYMNQAQLSRQLSWVGVEATGCLGVTVTVQTVSLNPAVHMLIIIVDSGDTKNKVTV